MTDKRPPATLAQQADHLNYVLGRCIKRRGDIANETWMLISAADYEDLRALETRLRRMARHENQIRNLVMGK